MAGFAAVKAEGILETTHAFRFREFYGVQFYEFTVGLRGRGWCALGSEWGRCVRVRVCVVELSHSDLVLSPCMVGFYTLGEIGEKGDPFVEFVMFRFRHNRH